MAEEEGAKGIGISTVDTAGIDAEPPREAKRACKAELSPGLKQQINEEVQRLVDREFDRITTPLKYMAGILAGIIVFLGVSTYVELRHTLAALVTRRVDALIENTDSRTGVKQQLEDLTNRALVTAFLIDLRKPELPAVNRHQTLPVKRHENTIGLSFADWARLKRWLQDEKLDDQEFADTVSILAAQEEGRSAKDAEDLLAEMLNPPPSSRYRWMLQQPGKRLAILQNFSHKGLGAAALQVALAEGNSQDLRSSAMTYIQLSQYREAYDELAKLAAGPGDEAIRLAALLTCAWLNPMKEEIGGAVDKLLAAPPTDKSIATSIKLAAWIWYAPSPVGEHAQEPVSKEVEQGRLDNAKRLLSSAFAHGAYVVVLSGDTLAFFVRSGKTAYEAFGTSKASFGRMQPYWDLLAELAASGDPASFERFERLVPRSCTLRGVRALTARLTDSAQVLISGFPALTATEVRELTVERSKQDEEGRQPRLTAYWSDKTGGQRKGLVIGLRGQKGQGFSFSLPRDFNSDTCISD